MCVIAVKYFPDHGWVGFKNRDRNYVPDISFKREKRGNTEIVLFWDDVTQYCEGMNGHGVCVISASLMVDDDEKEINTRSATPSKDGVKIKRSLQGETIKDVLRAVIDNKLTGHTFVYDKKDCYAVEGCWRDGNYEDRDYQHKVTRLEPHDHCVRTNHGIMIPTAGYQRISNNKNQTRSRVSSESRLAIGEHVIKYANDPHQVLDDLTRVYCTEPQLNALRTVAGGKQMRTTSQLMMIPSDFTMYVRPIQSNFTFNFWDHNQPKNSIWVEIVSNRVLFDNFRNQENVRYPRLTHNIK